MRQTFIKALVKEAQKDKRIWLLTGDVGYKVLEPFIDNFPDRYLNVGVAEQNLVTVAAGLATTGKIPVIYAIATFMTLKTLEQIRNDIVAQKLNVKIIGTGGGLAYSKYGPSHHAIEDFAILRTLPNLVILNPADRYEMAAAVAAMFNTPSASYLRIGWEGVKDIHQKPFNYKIGQILPVIKTSRDFTLLVLASGTQVGNAVEVAHLLAKQGIQYAVYSVPTIKPLADSLLKQLPETAKIIVTIEEHLLAGGLGTIVAEYLAENTHRQRPVLLRFGIREEYSHTSRNYKNLLKFYGLTPSQIVAKIQKFLTSSKK